MCSSFQPSSLVIQHTGQRKSENAGFVLPLMQRARTSGLVVESSCNLNSLLSLHHTENFGSLLPTGSSFSYINFYNSPLLFVLPTCAITLASLVFPSDNGNLSYFCTWSTFSHISHFMNSHLFFKNSLGCLLDFSNQFNCLLLVFTHTIVYFPKQTFNLPWVRHLTQVLM